MHAQDANRSSEARWAKRIGSTSPQTREVEARRAVDSMHRQLFLTVSIIVVNIKDTGARTHIASAQPDFPRSSGEERAPRSNSTGSYNADSSLSFDAMYL